MFKTFPDFVHRACQMYSLPFEVAEFQIVDRLRRVGLTPMAVVCYINWADGLCLSQGKIGKALSISQQAVQQQLHNLRKVWPYLFDFGPKIPRFNGRKSSGRGDTMGRLQQDMSEAIEKF